MREITEYDLEMSEKMKQWVVCDDKGVLHLREDAPNDVKKYYDKLKKEYNNY